MKIMHLSDLHIGKNLNGYSMIENQKKVFEYICSVIIDKKIEVIMIVGDIYDRSIPSEESIKLLDLFLSNLINKLKVKVIVIAGNHDSSIRLNFSSNILSKQGLYIIGEYEKIVNKVSIDNIDFYLMPFVTPATIRKKFVKKIEEQNLVISTYDDTMKFITDEIHTTRDKNRVNIALYHGFVIGSGENEEDIIREESVKILSVGNSESVSEKYFFGFDYTALGHLHGNRRVKNERVRYSGSPMKYSFSEKDQTKYLTIIDIDKNRFDIENIKIEDPYPMIELKGTFDEIINADIAKDAYLKITLTEPILDAMNKLRDKYSQIMELGIEIKSSEPRYYIHNSKDIQKIPINQLFIELAGSVGITINDSEKTVLNSAINEVMEEEK